MVKRRIMLIGATASGKTTLANVLDSYGQSDLSVQPHRSRQEVVYGKHTIEVPGGYFESPGRYHHLIAIAQNHAFHVLFIVNQSQPSAVGAPGFAKVFGCPVSGIVTRCSVKPENKKFCYRQLEHYGVQKPFFDVSVTEGIGVSELSQHLFDART
ncbi:EutP/PduV family microcompartment system protein [Halodesulfovibrio sp.]|jgi:ethanolamine utilization protein EutP|uniref:EutP/PduV family microcompartment system protein n=1 Tax=Halodesulfovibrio sp. TaxID=1912772 RepID=UPI0025F4CC0E|nr:EutP/PduV family microcompartment system protein [Halodesulfovibrio sp.]MCT4535120.1 EutP/PduV family microcompartment system protein [Halodesulfovibrio sp.]